MHPSVPKRDPSGTLGHRAQKALSFRPALLASVVGVLARLWAERGEAGPTYRPDSNAQPGRNLTPGEACGAKICDLVAVEDDSRAPDRPPGFGPVASSILQTGRHSLSDHLAFKLRQRGEHSQREFSHCGRRVKGLLV
jgi:hypothetical protein